MKRAKLVRQNRQTLERKLKPLLEELDALDDRDLSADAKQRERGRLRGEIRELYRDIRASSETFIEAAREDLNRVSPGRRRMLAAFENPARANDLAALMERVPDSDLPAFAQMAAEEGDQAAAFAITTTMGARSDLSGDDAREVSDTLARVEAETVQAAVQELMTTTAEVAGLAGDYALLAGDIDPGALNDAVGLGHAAYTVEVEGTRRTASEKEMDAAFKAIGMDRGIRPAEWPKPLLPGETTGHGHGTWPERAPEPEPAA